MLPAKMHVVRGMHSVPCKCYAVYHKPRSTTHVQQRSRNQAVPVRLPVVGRRRATQASPGQASNVEEQQIAQLQQAREEVLENFLVWLVTNGVEGIGMDNSKVALFEGLDGERGLMAMEPIAAEEVVLRIPLKLALTDYPGDEESNQLMYEGAPWSVRLAGKVLREDAKGRASAWYPYIQVLPSAVPSPLNNFTWEEMQDIQWEPTKAEIYSADWLVTDAYEQASNCCLSGVAVPSDADAASGAAASQAIGGASLERFQWACSVVHSRTFANAARTGGVGVRMLVPLVDMINHGGDVTASGSMEDTQLLPTDNVRWDLVPPAGNAGWVMAVKATQDISPDQQLVLSYGDRASDDYFVHYGFVPPLCNPHEDAEIFESVEAALEWHYEHIGSKKLGPGEATLRLYSDLLEQAEQEQRQQQALLLQQLPPAQQADGREGDGRLNSSSSRGRSIDDGSNDRGGGAEASLLQPGGHKLRVHAGGRVDSTLANTFDAAAAAISKSSSSSSSSSSSGGGSMSGLVDDVSSDAAIALRCWQLLDVMGTPLLHDLWLLREDARLRGAEEEELRRLGHLCREQVEREKLVISSGLWQHLEPGNASSGIACSSSSSSSGDSESALAAVGREVVGASPSTHPQLPLAANKRLCVHFRAAKKEVLWGVCGNAAAAAAKRSSPTPLSSIPVRNVMPTKGK